MFQTLVDVVGQKEHLKRQNDELIQLALEIKNILRTHHSLPPQVLLQQPVVLHDARGRSAPFHLEFITCREQFVAVLTLRFKATGPGKIIRGEFDLRDVHRRKELDLFRPWDAVFQVRVSYLIMQIPNRCIPADL
jgi:hypothetical protein